MIIKLIIFVVVTVMGTRNYAQLYFTKNGHITFYSKTIVQNIEADNNQVISVLDSKTGSVQFSVLNNAFHFEKTKMEDDFNEDYMESSRYPKSTFKGDIKAPELIHWNQDGQWPVTVSGDLFIHGVSRHVSIPATVTIKNGAVSSNAVFNVKCADYNIKVPQIVSNKLAETIQVTVNCVYEKKE